MSVPTNSKSILKVLGDLSAASDKIINDKESVIMFPKLLEWISLLRTKAVKIIEGESTTRESKQPEEEMPNLMTYLKGPNKRKVSRGSSALHGKIIHLHKKGERASIKTKYISRGRQSLLKTRKSSTRITNKKQMENDQDSTLSSPQGEDKISPECITPSVQGKRTDTSRVKRSSNIYRKSSSAQLPSVERVKKPKILNGNNDKKSSQRKDKISSEYITPSLQGKSTDTSRAKRSSKRKSLTQVPSAEGVKKPKILMGNEKKVVKIDTFKRAKNSSLLLPNTKSSVGAKSSVIKESNAMQWKIETKQEKANENRKNILVLRLKKMEENKRIREEKNEKTLEKRMKLEKEKLSKFKEKRNLAGESCNKEATPKNRIVTKTNKHTENETIVKSKEKQLLSSAKKKLQMNSIKAGVSLSKSNEKEETSHSFKNKPNHQLAENKMKPSEKVMNATFTHAHSEESVQVSVYTNSKDKNLKDLSTCTPGAHKKGKAVPKTTKPLVETEKHIITPVAKKGIESYVITPARSSIVSYDISEIHSDSEEEEQRTNSKPIPSWATGVRLRNALLHQHHHPIDTDALFGNFFETPNLSLIMGVKKKHYNKRTSSAIWNSSFA